VIARQSVWARPEIQELAKQFVAVADEVGRLQSGNSPDCVWFQRIAEQGHYAGRTQPTATRQGIYFAAPNGDFLTSLNSTRWEQVAAKMEEALAIWKNLEPTTRRVETLEPEFVRNTRRKEQKYPEQGLVWQVYSRDLPRDAEAMQRDWRSTAWNQDFAWVRQSELAELLPAQWEVGFSQQLSNTILNRLCLAHLVDNVRGQTPPYRPNHIKVAEWSVEVVGQQDGVFELVYRGRTRTAAEGRWPVQGHRDSADPSPQERGIETELLGKGRFNSMTNRFVEFDLAFTGIRWGGTQYNGRHDDLDPAPIGYVLRMVDDRPRHRVAPELFWAYGW